MIGLWWLMACGTPTETPAEPPIVPGPVERAVRFVEGPAGPVLEVAADRYVHRDGGEVLLLGTVHVADPAFYTVSVARLEELDAVLVEGLVDDVEPLPPVESSTANVLGLQHQGAIDVDRPGWSVRDLAESDLQARMRADGIPELTIRQLLVDDPGTSRADLPDDARGTALARLRYMWDVSAEETGPVWKAYMLGMRDAHVVDGVSSTGRTAVWFGADHLGGMGELLHERGWSHVERVWTPAIATSYSELELGPVQVQQLVDGWASRGIDVLP